MNDLFLFISCTTLTVVFFRLKRFMFGDFIVIQRDLQPIMFWSAIISFSLFAFDGLCNSLSLFIPNYFTNEKLKILDDVIRFFGCFIFSIICIFVKNITIKKKPFTWKETPLIRSSFVIFFLVLSVYFLMQSVTCL